MAAANSKSKREAQELRNFVDAFNAIEVDFVENPSEVPSPAIARALAWGKEFEAMAKRAND